MLIGFNSHPSLLSEFPSAASSNSPDWHSKFDAVGQTYRRRNRPLPFRGAADAFRIHPSRTHLGVLVR